MIILNITIPTYNRPNQLLRCITNILSSYNIENLLPQIHITVVDNNSNYDVKHLLSNLNLNYSEFITLYKNPSNIGMANNFIKCFEYSVGEYTWIFSDDETINHFTLDNIIQHLVSNSYDIIFLNNSRIKKNKGDKTLEFHKFKKSHFIKKVSVFNALITKNIFRTKHFDLSKTLPNTLFPFLITFYESVNKDNAKTLYIDGDLFTVTSGDSSGYNWFDTFVNDLTNIHSLFPSLIDHSCKIKMNNDLIKYFLFKQFLIVGLKKEKIKRNTLQKFEKYDFKTIFSLLKNKFYKFVNFYIFILTIYLTPLFLRRFIYFVLIEFYQPFYRKRD